MSQVNEALLEFFRAHGVESVPQDEWIAFPGRDMRANASIAGEMEQQSAITVQLDVELEIAPGRTISESFAGLGETREEAVADALQSFTANSFHVLLAAFFGSDDPHVSQEEWVIGGRTGRVTIGDVGTRGTPPVQGDQRVGWLQHFEEKLKEQQLRPGTNWVRLYYGQAQGSMVVCEVLLNNYVWEEMQSEMAAADWPSGEEFYSVRVFLVIQVEKGGSVSPETAVAWLADIVAPQHEFTQEDVFAAMTEAGVPDSLADRAYNFMQTAWARPVLADLGVQFSSEYVCFNASGEVVESGRLADEPCFAAASQLVRRYAGTPGFRRLALLSADIEAVNAALRQGSRPEGLVTAPAFVFLEAPTRRGMKNARRVIDEHVASLKRRGSREAQQAAIRPARPWWRFWS
jgi:hypothetical protein